MDEVIRLAVVLAAVGTAEPPLPSATAEPPPTVTAQLAALTRSRSAAWPGEDRFRHAAMSWAVTSFTYAAARAAERDGGTALVIGVSASAIAGLGKELMDRREGGPFSAGDLLADVVGTGLAFLVLREVQ
jgi:uncharacterized protein YfiM (DUF2279 family)